MTFLQDRVYEDEQYIQKMEVISEEDVKTCLAQGSIRNHLMEDLYRLTPAKVTCVESQLAIHEVTVMLLEPLDYQTITTEANASGEYISNPAGPT